MRVRSLAIELVTFSVLSFYQVYGIFYATSFLDLYRNPKSLTTSQHNRTVLVSGDEQYLFLVSFLMPGAQGIPGSVCVRVCVCACVCTCALSVRGWEEGRREMRG